jgi:signal peptidase I
MRRLALNCSDFAGLARGILSSGGSFRFIAAGQSMWPFIRNGAHLDVIRAEPKSLKIGDVVLYNSAHRVAVHRIIKITRNNNSCSFLLRGDGCYDEGEPVEAHCVIGRVVRVEQNGFLLSKRIIRSIKIIELVRKIRQVLWYIKRSIRLPTISGRMPYPWRFKNR